MNDRELLEAAARAAGHELDWHGCDCTLRGDVEPWDPLRDDGDALRLAVKLRLCLLLELPRIGIGPMLDGPEVWVDEGEDEMDATRRAIVRAAASMAPPADQGDAQ